MSDKRTAVVKTARKWTKCDWAVSFIDELQLKVKIAERQVETENRWATSEKLKQMSDKQKKQQQKTMNEQNHIQFSDKWTK